MRSAALAMLLYTLPLPAGAVTGLTVSAHRDGDALIVEAQADLAVSGAQAWDVLTDYERLTEFIPDLLESRVLDRQGRRVWVAQKGRISFLFFRFDIALRLEVDERPPSEIVARAVEGSFHELQGRYRLEPRESGIRLLYDGRFVPAFGVPRALGDAALKRAVEKQFSAMVQEIERRYLPPPSARAAGPRLLATVAIDGIECTWKRCTS